MVPGRDAGHDRPEVPLQVPDHADEHIFKAGHQIAIIVAGTNTSDVSGTGNDNVAVTLDTRTSKVTLPIQSVATPPRPRPA